MQLNNLEINKHEIVLLLFHGFEMFFFSYRTG